MGPNRVAEHTREHSPRKSTLVLCDLLICWYPYHPLVGDSLVGCPVGTLLGSSGTLLGPSGAWLAPCWEPSLPGSARSAYTYAAERAYVCKMQAYIHARARGMLRTVAHPPPECAHLRGLGQPPSCYITSQSSCSGRWCALAVRAVAHIRS